MVLDDPFNVFPTSTLSHLSFPLFKVSFMGSIEQYDGATFI